MGGDENGPELLLQVLAVIDFLVPCVLKFFKLAVHGSQNNIASTKAGLTENINVLISQI